MEEFYNYEIPGYIKSAGKSYITINCGHEWNNSIKPRKIRITDVIEYYRTQANNIVSGCRTIADFTGDWRGVDLIAKECLEYFKFVNPEVLRREGRKAGLEPKF